MEQLRAKKGYICDMDGVIYWGGRLLPGVKEFVDWLQSEGKQFLFLTNNSGKTPRELQDKLARMGLEGMEQKAIGALSGGQLQRTLLGRAVVSDPEVVILDEPATYLDRRFEARLYQLLAEINRDCAIILVSHDIGTVLQQVKSIACVNETLHYHPDTGITGEWLEQNFNCPIELLGHGNLPHRILGKHTS